MTVTGLSVRIAVAKLCAVVSATVEKWPVLPHAVEVHKFNVHVCTLLFVCSWPDNASGTADGSKSVV